MKFTHDFPSRRSVVMACDCLIATSQPLAALAGLRIMQQGGNAVDAAVAAGAMLTVVEPRSTGLGGDAFGLIYMAKEKRLFGLNGSGRAPAALTVEYLRSQGQAQMPHEGPLSITVPGIVDGWATLLARFGNLGLDTVLAPAIDYAEKGFPVTEEIADRWQGWVAKLLRYSGPTCRYLPDGRAPRPGELFRNPDIATTLRTIAEGGAQAFYSGPLAARISQAVQKAGGVLQETDLAAHTSTWVEPISVDYRGHTVYELPPNGQGLVALIALGIAQGFPLASLGHNTAEYAHILAEALKLGFGDAARHVADPQFYTAPLAQLLSEEYLSCRRSLISPYSVLEPDFDRHFLASDTVYLTVVDGQRNAVSFINSVFSGFGSGLVVDGTGIVMQNRGAGFRLDEGHPNVLQPGKRPYHTIIPAMIFRDGQVWASYGVMGGLMQAQGHVQVACNLIDFEMSPQAALDAPRLRYMGQKKLALEAGFEDSVVRGLRARGHDVQDKQPGSQFGGGQAIVIENGILFGGSDPRKDGCAVGY